MHFTPSLAVAILAVSCTVPAAPRVGAAGASGTGGTSSASDATTRPYNPSATYATTPASASATQVSGSGFATTLSTPAAATMGGISLSLTQQLSLAETRADFFKLLPSDTSFVFDFRNPNGRRGIQTGNAGRIVAANRQTFPALVGTGVGAAVGFLGPCGFNTPHVHPRGTELLVVTTGRLVTEMVPENEVRVVKTLVEQYQMTLFYQGSVHTQYNPDCGEALFVAFYPAEDFGTGQAADGLFALSDDVVEAAFGGVIEVDGRDVDQFRHLLPSTIAIGVNDCLKKCGLN